MAPHSLREEGQFPIQAVQGDVLAWKPKEFAFLRCSISCIHCFGAWPRRNILRMLRLQKRGEAGMCILPCLGHLQEPTASFPAWSLSTSPFALAWVLSHAAVDLGEGEDDKSSDIMVLTFPLWKPSYDDSLGFSPAF